MVKEEYGEELNGKQIFDLYHSGNQVVIDVVEKWIDYLTDGLGTLAYIFNPSLIVIGGGVTKQGDYLLDKINKSLDGKIGENYKKNLQIKFAELGNDAGLIGATYLLLKKLNRI